MWDDKYKNYSSYNNNYSNKDKDKVIKFTSRKLASWQFPEDIRFSKKISERFDPAELGDRPNVKIDYYRQASKEVARDPRDSRALPNVSKVELKAALFDTSGVEWVGGEPPRHILIEQISPKLGIKSELNLYALLEETFDLAEEDVVNINLHFGKREICASVLFTSGFKAWEIVKMSIKKKTNWNMRIDSGAREYDRIKLIDLQEENVSDYRDVRDSRDTRDARDTRDYRDARTDKSKYSKYPITSTYSPHTPHTTDSHSNNSQNKLSCSPFVPCLRIPYSCENSLPFRLTSQVLTSIFPLSRFPSFSGVEEGSSTWHVHFGREIDIVEADQMLQRDIFTWKGDEFYFERWNLVKADRPWSIPEHYKKSSEPSTNTKDKSTLKTRADDVDDLPSLHELITESSISEGDFLKLPKFIKKRPHEPSESAESETEEPTESSKVKVKVKRKPIVKKQPFVPPPMPTIKPEEPSSVVDALKTENHTVITNDTLDVEIDTAPLSSGSCRTEGFFILTPEEKQRVRFKGILEAFSSNSANINSSNGGTNSSNDSATDSRSSRAQNRRPLPNVSSAMLMDFFKVSPLQSTQKLVALRNSSIHSYGLVIMEPADPGDLIIEYVGELVRASVANIREWKYEREYKGDGIASSYLFRLDGIMVIDATHQGNLARFINHSCDPNCVAKTITLNGSKRIVMYAKKAIRAGEEITYDYKFPIEKDPKKKVKCLCGSNSCRKYLN